MNFSRPVRQLFYPGGERQRGDRRETLICVSPPPTLKNQDTMSRKNLLTLCRRLWAVQAELYDAFLIFDRARWQAKLRREERLKGLILNAEWS